MEIICWVTAENKAFYFCYSVSDFDRIAVTNFQTKNSNCQTVWCKKTNGERSQTWLWCITPGWVSAPRTEPVFALRQAAELSRAVFCVLISLSWISNALTQLSPWSAGKEAQHVFVFFLPVFLSFLFFKILYIYFLQRHINEESTLCSLRHKFHLM